MVGSGWPSVDLKRRAPAGRQSGSLLQYWHGREKRRDRKLVHPAALSHAQHEAADDDKGAAGGGGGGMLTEVLSSTSLLQLRHDDDFNDRLHYYYTTSALLVSALLISAKMFGGRPLECWVPAEYTKSWEDYSEMYCWARNTYFVPFDSSVPTDVSERDAHQVSYYQWTPFFLLICAFAFYFPCILWRVLNDKSGVRLRDIISVAQDKANVQPASRAANIQALAAHLLSIFRHQFSLRRGGEAANHVVRGKHRFARWLNWRYYEAYMTMTYLFIKLLYLLNVTGQLFLMNSFLQTDDYGIYGLGVVADLLRGKEWQTSGNFPRVTLCDFHIRVLGNVQRHTVQCVLVINIFTEKLFILLWLWYTALIVLTLTSFVYWTVTSFTPAHRHKFIARRLEMADTDFRLSEHDDDVRRFAHDCVKTDGVFVLRMIALHTGAMFATELVDAMWDMYLGEKVACGQSVAAGLLAPLTGEPKSAVGDDSEAEAGGAADTVRQPTSITMGGGDGASAAYSLSGRPLLRRKNSVFVPLMLGAAAVATAAPALAHEDARSPASEPATAPVALRRPLFQPKHHRTLLERRLAPNDE